jgi:enoyl-CoA hydratase/carnithine racemase
VLTITLNRPEKKNAMNAVLMNELAFALSLRPLPARNPVVVLAARGTIFVPAPDLKAFAGEVQSSHSSIPEPPEPVRLGDVFADLHKPCIARVHALSMPVASCSWPMHPRHRRFQRYVQLAEVKRGLFPFQSCQPASPDAGPTGARPLYPRPYAFSDASTSDGVCYAGGGGRSLMKPFGN